MAEGTRPHNARSRRSLNVRRSLAATLLCGGLALSACAADPYRLPKTYLVIAQEAVKTRDAPAALAALNQAEGLWLSGNSPLSSPFVPFNPEALRNMGNARVAIQMGRWGDAEYYIRTAITQPSVVQPG